jgi:hypothetical protein
MLGVPTPNEADPRGEWYAFAKGAEKTAGGDGFEVHTKFTNTVTAVHSFTLADLAATPKEPLRVLRTVMRRPEELRPSRRARTSPRM